MHIEETGLQGLLLMEPRWFRDERGFFLGELPGASISRGWHYRWFCAGQSLSLAPTCASGLHFTVKAPQAQIVTVMRGRIFDVAVDLRSKSPTFGRWFGAVLSDDGPRQIYMAPGFAHGFCVLSEFADLHDKVSRIFDASDEGGLVWNDPDVGIRWPIKEPIISGRDAAYPKLRSSTSPGFLMCPIRRVSRSATDLS